MNSTIKHGYDALLAFRSVNDRNTAVTADGAASGLVSLHRLTAGRGDLKNLYGQTPFDVVIAVGANTGAVTLKLQSVDANGANPVDVPGGSVVATAGNTYVLKFDPATIAAADADAASVRIYADVEPSTGSVSYFAFAAPNSKA